MDHRDARRIDILEEKLKWQKRVLAGLAVVFLFSASPASTTAAKWFSRILPSKALSGQVPDRTSPELISEWTVSNQPEGEALSKRALAAGDTMTVGLLRIVNQEGKVVGEFGYGAEGNGGLTVNNKNEKLTVLITGDNAGGSLFAFDASRRAVVSMGADDDTPGNGFLITQGASGSFAGFFASEAGDAAMNVYNRDGSPVAAVGANADGHGGLLILSDSEQPIAAIDAGANDKGSLRISGRKFEAFVDENGNGVAQTRSEADSIRWSSETPSDGLLGDLDGNGEVDFADFVIFARNFGKTSG